VAEHRTKDYKTTILVDGKPREVTVPVPETIYVAVPEQHTIAILPTIKDFFQFGIIVLAVLFGFYYAWIVLSALHRDKKAGGRPTATTRDTAKRADKVFTFLVGLIVGFMGAGGYKAKSPIPPPSTNEQIDQY